MKKTIGGDRLGAGKKMTTEMRNYEHSTHNLSRDWRSTMSVGTLVPCFVDVALNGDTWEIDINSLIKTMPTNQPLFGSFKFQVDVFECPIRLYNGVLHNNMQKIGMDMSKVIFPTLELDYPTTKASDFNSGNDKQISSDSLLSYLGIKGIGLRQDTIGITPAYRKFNAVPLLAYYDIFKNYYANKQESKAYVIDAATGRYMEEIQNKVSNVGSSITTGTKSVSTNKTEESATTTIVTLPNATTAEANCYVKFEESVTMDEFITHSNINVWGVSAGGEKRLLAQPSIDNTTNRYSVTIADIAGGTPCVMEVEYTTTGQDTTKIDYVANISNVGSNQGISTIIIEHEFTFETQTIVRYRKQEPIITAFDIENLDQMRIDILKATGLNTAVNITKDSYLPYNVNAEHLDGLFNGNIKPYMSQVGLMLKTYQSDLYNNWLSSEWIEGANGIAELTAVDTSQGSFTMDTLNLSQKIYNMLNRIAVSGGSWEDWQEAVWGDDAIRRAESPIYCGGMSCEIAFEEVVSQAGTNDQPLGTLAGKGREIGHKGGSIEIKVKEPSFIIAIASITPRIDYWQGNKWYMTELKTINDLHKPALDGIGFQNLMSEQMAWWAYNPATDSSKVIGKLPAWMNYMTAVNETHGNFAGNGSEVANESSMVINRNYDKVVVNGQAEIGDATTYIDPKKFNYLWAVDDLTSQYFWVQLGFKTIARRKMSAKIIPNL